MHKNIATLNQLPEGQMAQVTGLLSQGSMRRRLLDLGVVKGTQITCLQKSPAGDPIAYFIRGAVIALRTVDSRQILIKNC
ncbi:MAG: FeoA family protein [Bacillota bacterium]|jgi:ferrous iron transport protein A